MSGTALMCHSEHTHNLDLTTYSCWVTGNWECVLSKKNDIRVCMYSHKTFFKIKVVLVPQFFWTLTFNISGKIDSRSILFHRIVAKLPLYLSGPPLENLVNYCQNLRRSIFNKSVKQLRPKNLKYTLYFVISCIRETC